MERPVEQAVVSNSRVEQAVGNSRVAQAVVGNSRVVQAVGNSNRALALLLL